MRVGIVPPNMMKKKNQPLSSRGNTTFFKKQQHFFTQFHIHKYTVKYTPSVITIEINSTLSAHDELLLQTQICTLLCLYPTGN